ncbi:integrase catalytic domain-containing protein [Trichonephila clavipes]|nr:integrase catalytic domain-containing protein [Trichonephila clavipes]
MVKTLGMLWDSSGDSFTYKVTTSTDCNYTKRDVLSQIARIYDPLGLLGPVIAKAKIFMQQLWLLKLDWNETQPPDVSTQWRNFIQTLKDIESIHVPRCFLVVPTKFVVLNGFADASSKAYGAVIYVQTNETTNQGSEALLNTARLKYWPIGGRNVAHKVVHECVECFRNKPVVVTQIMGDLPAERVTSSSTFLNVGIDLCGPFEIKYMGQRKGTFQKIYVALFVCMATKAVHIEFVSDLTSEALIATLKKIFARRGKSSIIFSDNATNLTGASAEIKRLYKLMIGNENITNMLSSEGITWNFSPLRGPNFGGLWESGVKSFKYHLKRVVGSARLTLEEFLTVITQIEGILNSHEPSHLYLLTLTIFKF